MSNDHHDDNNKEPMSAWIRWLITLGIVILVNFASVAYFAGNANSQLANSDRRISALEATAVSKEQFNELKFDLKEIKQDVKDLGKRQVR